MPLPVTITLSVLGGLLVLFAAVFLVLIAPGKRGDIEKYKKVKYAHRGLHNAERAENSMSAFRAAVEAGFGIELDVRLSSDGVLVVFHDDTLTRVAKIEGRVDAFSADELEKMNLSDTGEGVPRFSEVLKMVDGRVPLLVEIKEDAGKYAVSSTVCEIMKDYNGPYIIESFNPLSLGNVKKKLPSVARGFLSPRLLSEPEYRAPLYFALQCLLTNRISSPAFIAYNHEHASSIPLRIMRGIFGTVTYAWTVRSPEEEAAAYRHGFDSVIFENYIPEK